MTLIWFAIFVVLLIIELLTVNLVSIWFSIGALFAMISSFFVDSIIIQIIIFVIASVIVLAFTKPIVKKFKGFNIQPTNSDRVIGKVGEVTKDIDKNSYGEVKVFGNYWTASSDEKITVGTKVKVLSIEGVKLIVKKEED